MKIACDYCDCTIQNKNKQFCNKECMTNYMRLKDCMMCHEKYEPKDDVFDGCDHFCSKECEDKHNIRRYIYNIEFVLGYGSFGRRRDHDLLELNYKVRNVETGEIIEGRVGSLKEELESYRREKNE